MRSIRPVEAAYLIQKLGIKDDEVEAKSVPTGDGKLGGAFILGDGSLVDCLVWPNKVSMHHYMPAEI